MNLHSSRRLAIAALFVAIGAPSQAAAEDMLRLEAATLPAPFILKDGKNDVVLEASGVEPIGDGKYYLVAHDKSSALHVVEAATGRHVGEPLTSAKFPAPNKSGPKWEAMARDDEGRFYLIGAHNGKTDEERATKSVLIRFSLRGVDTDTPSIDDTSVVRWEIGSSLVDALKSLGLNDTSVARRKIEGLTIRERKDKAGTIVRELIVGLREPGDQVRAFCVDITKAPADCGVLTLKPLFAFHADGREGVESQLTSLEDIPAIGGLLVVTASEHTDNAFHGNILWFVPDGIRSEARNLGMFEVAMKAEGLAVLGVETTEGKTAVKLLITFDNDPHATKIPSRFQTVTLVRETR